MISSDLSNIEEPRLSNGDMNHPNNVSSSDSDQDSLVEDEKSDRPQQKTLPHSEYSGSTSKETDGRTGWNTNKANSDDKNDPNNNNGISSSAETLREVRQIKIVILLVLLVSIAGAISVFFYTRHSEQQEFEIQFENDANKVTYILFSYKILCYSFIIFQQFLIIFCCCSI